MKVVSVEFLTSAVEPSHYPRESLPEVAFAGPSNVGKSSLINALVKRKKVARVSSTPGCTRFIQFIRVNNRFFFVDLPGYGYAKVPRMERKRWGTMIETYVRERRSLKLVVVVLDIRRDPSDDDRALLDWLRHVQVNFIVVLTKRDKVSKSEELVRRNLVKEKIGLDEEPLLFSARTGEGVSEVWKAIQRWITFPSSREV